MQSKTSVLRQKKNELLKEIEELTKIREEIKNKFEMRNNIQKLSAQGFRNRNGIYNNIDELPDFESKWKDSFFIKHRLIAEKYGSYVLSDKCIQQAKYDQLCRPFNKSDDYFYARIIVFCEASIPSPNGPVLKLTDPYGSILTDPLKQVELEETTNWIERILVADIGFNYKNDKHPLKGFKMLKFTLYNDLRNDDLIDR